MENKNPYHTTVSLRVQALDDHVLIEIFTQKTTSRESVFTQFPLSSDFLLIITCVNHTQFPNKFVTLLNAPYISIQCEIYVHIYFILLFSSQLSMHS